MKKVLWISRHEMTPEQYGDLRRIAGQEVELLRFTQTVSSVAALQPQLADADLIAAVLPTERLSELLALAGKTPVLISESARMPTGRILTLPDGRTEAEFAYVHVCWKQLLHLKIETACVQSPADLRRAAP